MPDIRADGRPPELWEQQPDEGPEAFEAFVIYRDAGRDRSTDRASQQLAKSAQLIRRWSSAHGWIRRVTAYDRHLDSLRRQEHEDELVDLSRRQAVQLAAAAQALTQPVRAFLERVQQAKDAGEDPFAKMSTAELGRFAAMSVRYLPQVVEAERLVAGLSTESVNPDAPASADEARRRAESMSREELEQYLLGVDDGKRDMLRGLGVLDDADEQPPWPAEEGD